MRTAEVDASVTTELRRAVLRPMRPPGWVMPGDDQPDAVHVAVFDEDGTVIGACVVFADPCPHHPDAPAPWHLRGMATDAQKRGLGVGALVLAAAIDAVRRRDGSLLWCKARVTAAGFYAAHGFHVDGDDYVEPHTGLPHRDMSRAVDASVPR